MSIKQRLAAGLVLLVTVGGLSFATLTARAFDCGGWGNGQKDTFFSANGYYLHHWLGDCLGAGSPPPIKYYGGSDSRTFGGSWYPINTIYTHQRAWDCASGLAYDQSQTLYNAAFNQLVTPITCMAINGPQTDNNNEEYQPPWFDWWNYLNYNGT
ncbi:MAG TPA: hypothetical protein VK457_22195 [Chloroflexota bacterium]|nr:hypothetical protein [Chloroflexota bacterium]